MDEDFDYLFKILLIGDSSVGKTSLLLRYIDDTYRGEFQATIGVDFKVSTKTINGKSLKLQLWDTAGQDRFKNIVSTYYRGAQGIFIVFDVTNRVSFSNVSKWFQESSNFLPESTIRMLVGNKSDMGSPHRVVSQEEAGVLSERLGAEYVETSAKQNTNIDLIFTKMATSILSKVTTNPTIAVYPKPLQGKKVVKKGCC